MGEFEQIVWVTPAFDKRHSDPKKNYGIGNCRIFFVLKGPLGAVQFQIGTDWSLPEVQREQRGWRHSHEREFDTIQPQGWDVGYHSPKPMYEGQSPMGKCDLLETCYYDGSGLRADDWVPDFIAGGTKWLWPKLEETYHEFFDDSADTES